MKGYIHKGKVCDNGYVSASEVISDHAVLKVVPPDDGLHMKEPVIGNFEWWYFDITDIKNKILLKIVVHIGTDPLKTSIFPQLALSIGVPGESDYLTRRYTLSDLTASADVCRIQIKNELEIRVEHHPQTAYFIMVNLPEFFAELHLVSEIEGWKPAGNRVRYHKSGRAADFMWIIPSPKAKVRGYFTFRGIRRDFENVIGYHDHNYFLVKGKRPLYLDQTVKKWYWGKCYCGDYTLIFMDTRFLTTSLRSLFVARKDEIIHSSNNLAELKIEDSRYDTILGAVYPSSLSVCLKDDAASIKVFLESSEIIDRKDLLEGVPSLLKWMIKKLIAKPVYLGLSAKASLEIDGRIIEGFGNYEYMAFRVR